MKDLKKVIDAVAKATERMDKLDSRIQELLNK